MSRLSEHSLYLMAGHFKALSDPMRLRILDLLREEPHAVKAIVAKVGAAQPTVSKHLATLRQAGLVKTERRGTTVIYRLSDLRICDVCDILADTLLARIESDGEAFTRRGVPTEAAG